MEHTKTELGVFITYVLLFYAGWIELGAQWIHGEQHWLYDYAEQQQLLGRSAVLSKETGVLLQNGSQVC